MVFHELDNVFGNVKNGSHTCTCTCNINPPGPDAGRWSGQYWATITDADLTLTQRGASLDQLQMKILACGQRSSFNWFIPSYITTSNWTTTANASNLP